MTSKDHCSDHGGECDCERHKLYRRVFAGVLALIFLVLLIVFIIWLVLRPTKPQFYIQDASIFQLNLTAGANLLTTVMQVTLASHNPNDRIGVYYDKLDAFAVYKDQQITAATGLPAGYQGHNDDVVWSPYLNGEAVPVAPYVAISLQQDDTAGLVLVNVKVEGRLRWKVGTWVSGHYHLQVNCPAFVTIDYGKSNGVLLAFHFQHTSSCSVDV